MLMAGLEHVSCLMGRPFCASPGGPAPAGRRPGPGAEVEGHSQLGMGSRVAVVMLGLRSNVRTSAT